MGRDSNPRTPYDVSGFQDRCIKPLCHPSSVPSLLRIGNPPATTGCFLPGISQLRNSGPLLGFGVRRWFGDRIVTMFLGRSRDGVSALDNQFHVVGAVGLDGEVQLARRVHAVLAMDDA
jgi:hypothetical protein